jgi:TolB-like protein/Tfp pilus assembly protein PilF
VNRGLIWYTDCRMPVAVSGQQDQTPDVVREHLDRVLDSPQFRNSWRRARFLRAVVERSLEGKAEYLKESVVGVMVFDRPPDYDPKIDSIVRVQARQLRDKLREYYAGPGSAERIRIELPKGSYAPVIRTLGQVESTRVVAIDSATPRPAAHLAVIPFESLGPDPDTEYFSEGITEEILTALARVRGLRLIARGSAFQFKGQDGDVRRIARQLNVECILEGSVRRSGDRIGITAQLILGADGTHLWGETFDACIADSRQVFAIQEAIALEIISHLRTFVRAGALSALAISRGQTSSVEAYQDYLEARKLMRELHTPAVARAIPILEAAIAKDETFAAAHAALATCYGRLAVYGAVPSGEALARIRESAGKALDLEPKLTDGHTALGFAAALDLNLDLARGHFDRALALDPQNPFALQTNAMWYLGPTGQTRQAAEVLEALLQLDPLSLDLRHNYIAILYFDRRFAQVVEQATALLKLAPQSGVLYFFRFLALERLGQWERASQDLADHVANFPYPLLDCHLASYRLERAERHEEAVGIAREMEEHPAAPLAATVLADLWIRFGDRERAIDWLEEGFANRTFRLLWMDVDSSYDTLRGNPRFEALRARIIPRAPAAAISGPGAARLPGR